MPYEARILAAGNQDGNLVLWAQFHPGVSLESRTIVIAGTGQPFGIDGIYYAYLDTVQIGELVWHLFEEVKA
jgi:hypothetical protein